MMQLARFALLAFALTMPMSGQQAPAPAPAAPSSPPAQGKQPAPAPDSTADVPPSAQEDIEVANYYLRKGDQDAAIPRLEEAIQLQPKLARPYLLLADIYEKKRDAASAVKYYKEYLQVFPRASDAKKIQKKIEKLTSR